MSEVSNKESLIIERTSRYERFSVEQKRQFIAEASSVGNTISLVSRKYGIAPSCLYEWRRQMEEGAMVGLKTGKAVVPLSEHKALKVKLGKLERMLGRKTIEVEILKEAVELGREKNSSRAHPCTAWRVSGENYCFKLRLLLGFFLTRRFSFA